MLFVVMFEDHPDKLHLRPQYMEAHKKFLQDQEKYVLGSGSMRTTDDDKPVGGLWIMEGENAAEVESVYKQDPFWTCGLRKSVTCYRWSKAFEKKRPI